MMILFLKCVDDDDDGDDDANDIDDDNISKVFGDDDDDDERMNGLSLRQTTCLKCFREHFTTDSCH